MLGGSTPVWSGVLVLLQFHSRKANLTLFLTVCMCCKTFSMIQALVSVQVYLYYM
jgi:hypothetical protein